MRGDPLALPAVPPPAPADHPVRDTLVALGFAIAIALPGFGLVDTWSSTLTSFENRPMAPWPAFTLSRAFAPAFERAFADRFGGRDLLVGQHHATLLRAFGVSALPAVLPGRNGWYYWLGEDAQALDRHYRGVLPVPQAEIDATVRELVRRREWLASQGIAYVVAVVPEKYTIYPEHLPAWVAPSQGPTPLDRLSTAMTADGRVDFLDLRPALRAAKTSARLYYQTDSHWNYNGAIVGYETLMQSVQRVLPRGSLPAVAPPARPAFVPGEDYFSGDLGRMLGLPDHVREDDVAPLHKVLADSAKRCAQRLDKGEYPGFEFFACNRPGLPRAVILRDSMAIPLIPLLSENFSRVVYVESRKLDRALIEREKPAIVIEELVERSLHAPGILRMDN